MEPERSAYRDDGHPFDRQRAPARRTDTAGGCQGGIRPRSLQPDAAGRVTRERRGARYVGAVGSRKTQSDRRARLAEGGLTPEEIHKVAPGWLIFRDGCPGGETPEQVGARIDRVIARSRAVGGDVALFAHGHVLRVLAARWIGLPR